MQLSFAAAIILYFHNIQKKTTLPNTPYVLSTKKDSKENPQGFYISYVKSLNYIKSNSVGQSGKYLSLHALQHFCSVSATI